VKYSAQRSHKKSPPLTKAKKITALAGSRQVYRTWLQTTAFKDGRDIYFVHTPDQLRGMCPDRNQILLLPGYECCEAYDSIPYKICVQMGVPIHDFSDRKLPALGLSQIESQAIINFLFPLARRYVDGRESTLAITFNKVTKKLTESEGYVPTPDGTPWARSLMGRKADGLTDEEAALGDPVAMWQKDLPNQEIRKLVDQNATLRAYLEMFQVSKEVAHADATSVVAKGAG